MWFDAHCHLDQYEDPNRIIQRAAASGVEVIFGVPETFEDTLELRRLANEHDEVYYFIGLHPQKVTLKHEVDEQLRELRVLINEGHKRKLVGLGEIGLDWKYGNTLELKARQEEVFREQLRIAEELDYPVNVHSRMAEERVLAVLEEFDLKHVILHWFQGSKDAIRQGKDNGYYFSIGPSILSSKTYEFRAREVGLDHLLTETDGPVPFNGKSAEPEWIPKIGQKLAGVFDEDVNEVENRLEKNLKNFIK